MNHLFLTDKQLSELDYLFELVCKRQIKDFGNISASNKADGSLITSCDLWSDQTIVDGLASIAPDEGVLSEEGEKCIPNTKAYWVVDPLDGTTNFAAGIPYWSISVARFVDRKPQASFLIIPTLGKKFGAYHLQILRLKWTSMEYLQQNLLSHQVDRQPNKLLY